MKRSRSLMRGVKRTTGILVSFLFFSVCISACGIAYSRERPTEPASETDPIEIAVESVVKIRGNKLESQNHSNIAEKNGNAFNGVGTGVIIDSRGYIVTNFHVIDGIRQIQVSTQDGQAYTGVKIASDPVADLAIIKINVDHKKFLPIKFGQSTSLKRGQYPVFAIGNPLDDYSFSVTHGAISFLGRNVPANDHLTYRNAIQTSININPGNSGGPLLNASGEMIGMIAAIRKDAAGISFAIPVDQVVDASTKMILQKVSRSLYHGFHVKQTKNAEDGEDRLVVGSVDANSPAEKCGIEPGDVLLSGNERELASPLDLALALLEFKSNETFPMKIHRNREEHEVALVFAPQNRRNGRGMSAGESLFSQQSRINQVTQQPEGAPAKPNPRYGKETGENPPSSVQEMAWKVLGIHFSTYSSEKFKQLFPQYVEHYYPEGGIKVEKVRPDSPLHLAGIQQGDTIFEINDWIVAENDDVLAITSTLQSMKQGQEKTIEAKVMLNRPESFQGEVVDNHYEAVMEF